MIDNTSYASDLYDELGLSSLAYGMDVAADVDLTASAYAEDVAEAVNDGGGKDYTLRVLQYNIGHFNMGYAEAPQDNALPTINNVLISSAKSDGWTATPVNLNRNYDIQLERWCNRLGGIKADVMGLPEYNRYFGWMGSTCKTVEEAGIFDGYNLSVGHSECYGWWQNTLASKYAMTGAEDIDLGSTTSNKAYVRVATITINGKSVKIAVTHLNWNNPLGATSEPAYSTNAELSRASRQVEIKSLVKLFKDDPYVILIGDFNTQGQVYAQDVPSAERNWLGGLDEFDPFIEGFEEDGVTYPGGFTLANSKQSPLKTAPATNARPDTGNLTPSSYLDNIIVKGFTISNVTAIDDGSLTDHFALYCDLTMIESEVDNG